VKKKWKKKRIGNTLLQVWSLRLIWGLFWCSDDNILQLCDLYVQKLWKPGNRRHSNMSFQMWLPICYARQQDFIRVFLISGFSQLLHIQFAKLKNIICASKKLVHSVHKMCTAYTNIFVNLQDFHSKKCLDYTRQNV